MKTKLSILSLLGLAFSLSSSAQSTATADATALLVTPISISKDVNMDFGTVAASATAGTVVLDYDGSRTTTGGATTPAGGTPTAAQFTVTGEGTSSFSITLPTDPISLDGSVSGTITLTDLVADAGTSSALVAGTKTIKVKGTLNVPADTVAGTYSNTTDLTVSVNYN